MSIPPSPRRLTAVTGGPPSESPNATELSESELLRARALRLLAIGVGDHTPAEVREQVSAIARRLAELEPPAPVDEWH